MSRTKCWGRSGMEAVLFLDWLHHRSLPPPRLLPSSLVTGPASAHEHSWEKWPRLAAHTNHTLLRRACAVRPMLRTPGLHLRNRSQSTKSHTCKNTHIVNHMMAEECQNALSAQKTHAVNLCQDTDNISRKNGLGCTDFNFLFTTNTDTVDLWLRVSSCWWTVVYCSRNIICTGG